MEKLRKQTFSWRTQKPETKKESKPKSNLNLSNKKTQ